MVYKDLHLKPKKVSHYLAELTEPKKVLIVFWHGLGDTLMFLPLYRKLVKDFPQHQFTLGLLPGVGQRHYLNSNFDLGPVVEIPEAEFTANHDLAFVSSFPMVEGAATMTKVDYCCKAEFGMEPPEIPFSLLKPTPKANRLVGLHLQGTCLPGSTNPDEALAKMLWDDVREVGGIPIDLHFVHVFHNPANKPFSWATRHCRDLPADITYLQGLMERCAAVVAVASGPFVLALSLMPHKLIYLQKHHDYRCYSNVQVASVSIKDYALAERRQEFKDLLDCILFNGYQK